MLGQKSGGLVFLLKQYAEAHRPALLPGEYIKQNTDNLIPQPSLRIYLHPVEDSGSSHD